MRSKKIVVFIKSIIIIVTAAGCIILAGKYSLEAGLVCFSLCILNFILGKIFNNK